MTPAPIPEKYINFIAEYVNLFSEAKTEARKSVIDNRIKTYIEKEAAKECTTEQLEFLSGMYETAKTLFQIRPEFTIIDRLRLEVGDLGDKCYDEAFIAFRAAYDEHKSIHGSFRMLEGELYTSKMREREEYQMAKAREVILKYKNERRD